MANLQVVTPSLSSETVQSTQWRTWYESRLLDTLHLSARLIGYADMSTVIPENAGQTASWRKLSRLAAATTALTEGSAGTATNLVYTEVTALVEQYGDHIEWSDRFARTGPDANVSAVKGLQGNQAALTMDTLIQTALLTGSNVVYGGGAASRGVMDVGDTVDAADLDTAIAGLMNAGVPMVTDFIGGSPDQTTSTGLPAYIGIVNATILPLIRNISGFVSVEKYAGQTVTFPGEVGQYRDIRFIMTNNGLVESGGGASAVDVHFIHVFGAGAFGVSGIGQAGAAAVQSMDRDIDTPTDSDPLGQKGSVGWKMHFVAKLLDGDKVYRIETTAS